MKRRIYDDEYSDFVLEFESEDQLSWERDEDYVALYINDKYVAHLLISQDEDEDDREFISIDYTVIYLEDIAQRN